MMKIPEEEVESPLPPLDQHPPCESFSSLPNAIAVNCLARISIMYYPSLSLVSKTFSSLIYSPELYAERSYMKTTEICLYICLGSLTGPTRRWFSLCVKPNPNLTDGRSNLKSSGNILLHLSKSCPLYSNATVVVGSEIYVIGAPMDHDNYSEPSSVVRVYDCRRSHTWRHVPNMKMKRKDALACVFDDKIYVMGGCEVCSDNWFEMFDIKTQTWTTLAMIPDTNVRFTHDSKIDVVEGKIYVKNHFDQEHKDWIYDVNEGRWIVVTERRLSHEWINPWCVIDNVIYCYYFWKFIWYDLEARVWRNVKGLRALKNHYTLTSGLVPRIFELVNYGGKLAVLWDKIERITDEKKNIWCAVVTLERCDNERKISGKIEWMDVVRTVPVLYNFSHCLTISI